MLTTWTNRQESAKRPTGATMRYGCLWTGLSSSPVNIFAGALGHKSIDNRTIRH